MVKLRKNFKESRKDFFKKNSSNPLKIALITGFVSAALSVGCNFFLYEIKYKQDYQFKSLDAYSNFLKSINNPKFLAINKFLNIGLFFHLPATDGEIQDFEHELYLIINEIKENPDKILYPLINEINILKLYTSTKVSRYLDDIIRLLKNRIDDIDIIIYPEKIKVLYQDLLELQKKGVSYGWNEEITPEERFSIVFASILFNEMITEMKREIK